MPELSNEKLIQHIEKMSVLDLSELVKALEEKFDVSAAVVVPQAVSAVGGAAAPEEEQKSVVDIVLQDVGEKKIEVIKVVRKVTDLGLKEAKGVVDEAPSTVRDGVAVEEAEEIKKQFEEVGAKVDLK